jgi:hypothetical protein
MSTFNGIDSAKNERSSFDACFIMSGNSARFDGDNFDDPMMSPEITA